VIITLSAELVTERNIPGDKTGLTMDKPEVNRLITDKVDKIEDEDQRAFIKQILKFERDNLDQPMPRYSDDYKDMLDDIVLEDE
jgi:hypothetical protein